MDKKQLEENILFLLKLDSVNMTYKFTTYILLFFSTALFSQEQIGNEIFGEGQSDHSGYSVSTSENGDRLIIGAWAADIGGHARVFEYLNNTWSQIGIDLEGDANLDNFGSGVAISADGSRVVVRAMAAGNGDQSYARVYEFISNNWVQIGNDISGEESFGGTAMSSDGSRIAVGYRLAGPPGSARGSVKIFEEINATWTQVGSDILGGQVGDLFGANIAISNTGDIIAVGSPGCDNNGSQSGCIKVYQHLNSTWTQIGSTIVGLRTQQRLGDILDISGNGQKIVAGFPDEGQYGQARVYELLNNTWVQNGNTLLGKEQVFSGDFGEQVSIDNSGEKIAVSSESGGYIKMFQLTGNSWDFSGDVIDQTESYYTGFGFSISLSGDGNVVSIGAPENSEDQSNSGSVKIYNVSNSVLPVEWHNFEVNIGQRKTSILNWNTSLELDHETYIIERSSDGTEWVDIGENKEPHRSTRLIQFYSFEDKIPKHGVNYYRIRQMDSDGIFSYSPIRKITHADVINDKVILYPNPVSTSLSIIYPGMTLGSDFLEIRSVSGRIYKSEKLSDNIIDISNLPSGFYSLVIFNKKSINSTKFIKL